MIWLDTLWFREKDEIPVDFGDEMPTYTYTYTVAPLF